MPKSHVEDTAPSSGRRRGRFIVVEGPDGAGCSTQVRLLRDYLTSKGLRCEATKEPTDGPFGAEIRKALQLQIRVNPYALALAFAADRAYHGNHRRFRPETEGRTSSSSHTDETENTGIKALLNRGFWVVSDRYVLSSLVYQSIQGLDPKWLAAINDHAELVHPDATILISAPVSVYRQRLETRSSHLELFDGVDALTAVHRKYDDMIEAVGSKFTGVVLTVEGTGSPDEVHSRIKEKLAMRFVELTS